MQNSLAVAGRHVLAGTLLDGNRKITDQVFRELGEAGYWAMSTTVGSVGTAILVVVGVGLGSATWWVILTTVVGALRTRVTPSWIHRINLVSGVLIGAFAIVAIASALALGASAASVTRWYGA
jgi:hypothetical protein